VPAGENKQGKLRGGKILFYDRSILRNGAMVMSGLEARCEAYTQSFTLRVTKKFPEMFASWLKGLPPEIKVDLQGDLASFTQDAIAGRVRLDVTEAQIDWFDLRVVLDVDDTTLSQAEIKLLLNAKGGYVRLEGKGWRKLKFDLSKEEDEQLAKLGLSPHEMTAEPQRLHALAVGRQSGETIFGR